MSTNYARFFQVGKRDNGDRFVTLTDDRPRWLYEAVREAHLGDMPNDWIYEECYRAVQACDEGLTKDGLHEHADGRVDIYTKPLLQWCADMAHTNTYSEAEGSAQDLGGSHMTTIAAGIQYCAIQAIAATMLRACEEAQSEEEGVES